MYELIKIQARIELFSEGTGRKVPFNSGYRPIFTFKDASTKLSGRIDLIHGNVFIPGTSGVVNITFIAGMISNDHFKKGEQFTFSEGLHTVGSGEILEVY